MLHEGVLVCRVSLGEPIGVAPADGKYYLRRLIIDR